MSLPSTQLRPPGWYSDPAGGAGSRWWDGARWTGRRSVAARKPDLPPLGPRFAELADLLCRLLLANAVLSGVSVLLERAVHEAVVFEVLAVLALGLLLMTGVVWCAWQWRMAVSAPDRLRHGPDVHIGSWVIPVVNLWVPIQNMNQLWHAYEPRDARGRGGRSCLVLTWWVWWLATMLLGAFGLHTLLGGAVPDSYLGLAWALAATLAWFVVRRLSWRALLYHAAAAD